MKQVEHTANKQNLTELELLLLSYSETLEAAKEAKADALDRYLKELFEGLEA